MKTIEEALQLLNTPEGCAILERKLAAMSESHRRVWMEAIEEAQREDEAAAAA